MAIAINREKLLNIYRAELLYELHKVSECIRLFEKKYEKSFKEFEEEIKSKPEDFEAWDDYMEWKACIKSAESLKEELKELENGNFKLP